MLENTLNNLALNDAEKRTVQQQDQTKGIGAAWERYRAMDAKIEREEQKEEAAWEAWKSRSQTLAAQAAAAYQAYRQGERAEAPKTPTPTPTPTQTPQPVPPPTPPMPTGTPTPSATSTASVTRTASNTPTAWMSTPTAPVINTPAPSLTVTPTPDGRTQPTKSSPSKPWWVPGFSVQQARGLVNTIPSVGIGSNRIPVPVAKIVAPGKMISFGTVTAWDISSNANPNAELRVDGYGAGQASDPLKPQTFARVNVNERELESMVRIPSGVRFTEGGFEASHGASIYARVKWDGWNTTASVDMNYADVDASGAGLKGNISSGVYVEVKPLQVATVGVLITTVVLLTPVDEIGTLATGAWAALKEIGRQFLPQFGW
jgi:hypothetical protein